MKNEADDDAISSDIPFLRNPNASNGAWPTHIVSSNAIPFFQVRIDG